MEILLGHSGTTLSGSTKQWRYMQWDYSYKTYHDFKDPSYPHPVPIEMFPHKGFVEFRKTSRRGSKWKAYDWKDPTKWTDRERWGRRGVK